jgi:hypothetical protein
MFKDRDDWSRRTPDDVRIAFAPSHSKIVSGGGILSPYTQGQFILLSDLERALGLWDPAWSNPGIPARLPEQFTRLCLQNLPRPAADPLWYDLVEDPTRASRGISP